MRGVFSKMFTEKIIFTVFLVIAFSCAVFAQDFQPDPLEPIESKTDEVTTETTTTEISTDRPTKPTTTSTTTETATTTEKPTTTIRPTTTRKTTTTEKTSTEAATTTPTTTSNLETSSVTSNTPQFIDTTTVSLITTSATTEYPEITFPTTTSKPYYPSTPTQNCYFKKQKGMYQHFWTCEGLKWGYQMECYYCCQNENSLSAGCYRVQYSYCNEYYYY